MKRLLTALFVLFTCCAHAIAGKYITVEGNRLMKDGAPYFYVGANFWYGPILGSKGEGGNRERLVYELDSLRSMGVDNLRILVGAERGSKFANSVSPVLQSAPGVYDGALFDGLDYLLAEMEKGNMGAGL